MSDHANQLVQPRHEVTWWIASGVGIDALADVLKEPHHDVPRTVDEPDIWEGSPPNQMPDEGTRTRMVIELHGPDAAALHETIADHPVLSAYASRVRVADAVPAAGSSATSAPTGGVAAPGRRVANRRRPRRTRR